MEVVAYEPNYEGSPVVAPCREGAVPSARGDHRLAARPGHHLAPQVLSGGRNIYERLGDGFTLVALGADPALVLHFRKVAEQSSLSLAIVEDGAPEVRNAYGHALILVRPDHYVAWAGEEADPARLFAMAVGGGASAAPIE
jgi:hypothetical protein